MLTFKANGKNAILKKKIAWHQSPTNACELCFSSVLYLSFNIQILRALPYSLFAIRVRYLALQTFKVNS